MSPKDYIELVGRNVACLNKHESVAVTGCACEELACFSGEKVLSQIQQMNHPQEMSPLLQEKPGDS